MNGNKITPKSICTGAQIVEKTEVASFNKYGTPSRCL